MTRRASARGSSAGTATSQGAPLRALSPSDRQHLRPQGLDSASPGRRSGQGCRKILGGRYGTGAGSRPPLGRGPTRRRRASGFARSVPRGAQIESIRARMWRNVRVWTAVSDARLLLTCGLPAAGKTTLARQLAAGRRALRLTQDEWLIALGSSPWDASTRERVDHELWRLARGPAPRPQRRSRFWAVGEGRTRRDGIRGSRLGVGVELHYLEVPTGELWRRIEARNLEPPWKSYPIARADFDEWLRVFQAPDAAELALFDPPPERN